MMFKILLKNKWLFIFGIFIIITPQLTRASLTIISTTTLEISAYVTSGNSGGGGGIGGGGNETISATVNFSGMGYPLSKVTILQDGKTTITTIADPLARFSASVTNLTTGTHTFSIYSEDINGTKSLTFSFPIYITAGATINISGIFLSPTINIDKSQVKKGDTLVVFGQTVPMADVNIVFNSDQEIIRQTKTDRTGLYKYDMDTSPFEYGDHGVKSKTVIDGTSSATSIELPFIVGLISKLKGIEDCNTIKGDLNCDGRVNLIDFSIMAYWYKKPQPLAKIDLNKDGQVTLIDFSIMAYYWTG